MSRRREPSTPSPSNSNFSTGSYASGSQTRFRRQGWIAGLAQMLTRKGDNGPEQWTIRNRVMLKNTYAQRIPDVVNKALALAGLERNSVHPSILRYMNGNATFQEVFGKTPAKPKSEKKPATNKKVRFKNEANPGPGNSRNNPIIINAIKKLENKIKNQENAMVRARESQTQQALENSRRQLAQIRKEIREQQRNLREVVMRRGSVGGSYRPGGLRVTPYYTRYMERIYQRADGQFVTLSPNGRPGRPMLYPNFAYRDTGRGIVMHAPLYRRPRRKTLFKL